MDGWLSLKLKFEEALEKGNLVKALSHLDALITSASAPSDVSDLLTNHTFGGIATLHYLAEYTYREEDIPHLDKLIRIFTASGYDVNKVTDDIFSPNQDGSMEAPGYTALMASVEQNNLILLECLLRHGARADIQDAVGLTPCHWAIKNGNLKCLQKFFEHGGAALLTSALVNKGSDDDKLFSTLQEAVGNGHVKILRYLMTKEKLGAEVKSQLMKVDLWISLKLELNEAIEMGNLADSLSHLDALYLTTSSSTHASALVRNHTVKNLPTLHYLARFPFREEDIPQLDKLIKIFTDSGYDINKTSQLFVVGRASNGNTALLASVKQQNLILLECLLRHGAKADIRDPQGFCPCHWAIMNGSIKCLEKFFEHGLVALVTSSLVGKDSGDGKLISILHETMDNDHLEIVRYLMTKEELGVDAINLLAAVERWGSLKLKIEKALEMGNLVEVLSHRDALMLVASSSYHVRILLKKHTVKGQPTLHYLARFPFKEEDIPNLDKLIQIFIDFDYDINKTTDDVGMTGLTALLTSVDQQNLILMDGLLRHGARTDILDPAGFSPYHRAIKLRDLKCLQTLMELGDRPMTSTDSEKSGKEGVHPLLHTAVDEGCTEMVLYLLSKEELGVDLNEEAIYKDAVPVEHFDRYSWECSNWLPRKIDQAFTPLDRALFTGATQSFEALMTHPGATRSQFKVLHSFLEYGDTEKALDLLKYFSDEELTTDKTGDKWPLHRLHSKAFKEERHMEFTKKLILEYVRRGWDAKSKSSSIMCRCVRIFDRTDWTVAFERYSLLHLACLYGGHEIVKVLVEEAGANINCKTEGKAELTPLQILLILKDWKSAMYLIEKGADLNLMGSFEGHQFTRFMRKDLITGNLELNSSFNSLEILIRMGSDDGLALLDKLLASPEVKLHGGNEFHLAMEGRNLTFCLKVLQHCAKLISKEDLNWLIDCKWVNGKNPVKASSLIWYLSQFQDGMKNDYALVDLIKLMAELGCDLNIWRYDLPLLEDNANPLIFYILTYDLVHRTSNLLLRTFLQFDRLQLNVTKWRKYNLVEHLLMEWNSQCFSRGMQIVEAIHHLMTHGLDVSGTVIGRYFKYHNGSMVVLKMLYRAGAKILDEFFTSTTVCKQFSGGTSGLAKEKEELKKWKDEFDRATRMNLGHLCGLQVRKMMKCIGDLKMLDEIPKSLKAAVLCEGPTSVQAVTECGQGFGWALRQDHNYNDDYYEDYDPDVDFDD